MKACSSVRRASGGFYNLLDSLGTACSTIIWATVFAGTAPTINGRATALLASRAISLWRRDRAIGWRIVNFSVIANRRLAGAGRSALNLMLAICARAGSRGEGDVRALRSQSAGLVYSTFSARAFYGCSHCHRRADSEILLNARAQWP